MRKNKICAVITGSDRSAIVGAKDKADIFEVRIDMIGNKWQEIVPELKKPWIATNRSVSQQGKWTGSEEARIAELVKAIELGAWMIDIELGSEGFPKLISKVKKGARLLISYHDWSATPPAKELAQIVRREISAGAYACKVVTTANRFVDNISVLQLMGKFPSARVIAFAMGRDGIISRVMAPLAGAYFTYASLDEGSASAPGQVTAANMMELYRLIK